MPRKLAERHLTERSRQIADQIEALLPHEILTLASEMLTAGVDVGIAIQVAKRAVEKLECMVLGVVR